MPLIVMCGTANAGKSVRAKELQQYFREKYPSLPPPRLISEESLKFTRAVDYKDSWKEKNTRATFKSEVERWLSKEQIVILDSLNYIKGFRYELFCISKNHSTSHCIVFVDTPLEMAQKFYESNTGDKFPFHMLEEINFRFERPNSKNRWDSPLIIVTPHLDDLRCSNSSTNSGDDQEMSVAELAQLMKQLNSSSDDNNNSNEDQSEKSGDNVENKEESISTVEYKYMDEDTLAAIDSAIFQGKTLTPNISSLPMKLESTNFVFELDRITQAIVNAIIDYQPNAIIGDNITVPETSEKFVLQRNVTLSELRRLRRQFLKISQLHPPPVSSIGTAFVTYLNSSLNL